jgi:hypothetical protein
MGSSFPEAAELRSIVKELNALSVRLNAAIDVDDGEGVRQTLELIEGVMNRALALFALLQARNRERYSAGRTD